MSLGPWPPALQQVHITARGFDLPERPMIAVVPQPSAVARMILARQACSCEAPGEHADMGVEDPCDGAGDGGLEVLGQPSAARPG